MGNIASKHLAENTAHNNGSFSNAPMLDVREGGHFGYMTQPKEYVSAAAYIPGNVVCLLIEAPRGFQVLSNPDERVATLKALVEEQARTITGLNSTLSVEMSEVPVGGAGEVHQDIINVTRARSTPTFAWPEKLGRPINIYMEDWVEQLGMMPETKIPGIVTNTDNQRDVTPEDFLPDFRTMTCLFFEPDVSFKRVVKSWLCTNMFPMSTGENTGERDLTTARATLEHSIEFSSSTFVGKAVTDFAQEMLDTLSLSGVNPNLRDVYPNELSPDVAKSDDGYADGLR